MPSKNSSLPKSESIIYLFLWVRKEPMGKAEIAALESLLGGGKRRRRLGKKDSRFGPELTEIQQRKNARDIAKSQGKRRSGWEDPGGHVRTWREAEKNLRVENVSGIYAAKS
jgi:hypothetical protein